MDENDTDNLKITDINQLKQGETYTMTRASFEGNQLESKIKITQINDNYVSYLDDGKYNDILTQAELTKGKKKVYILPNGGRKKSKKSTKTNKTNKTNKRLKRKTNKKLKRKIKF